MNWKEIEKSYPKAWEKFKEWLSGKGEMQNVLRRRYIRILYDFFDEQGILISVSAYYAFLKEKNQYTPMIKYDKKDFDFSPFNTRTEAEEAAFEKSFEILENQLK